MQLHFSVSFFSFTLSPTAPRSPPPFSFPLFWLLSFSFFVHVTIIIIKKKERKPTNKWKKRKRKKKGNTRHLCCNWTPLSFCPADGSGWNKRLACSARSSHLAVITRMSMLLDKRMDSRNPTLLWESRHFLIIQTVLWISQCQLLFNLTLETRPGNEPRCQPSIPNALRSQ